MMIFVTSHKKRGFPSISPRLQKSLITISAVAFHISTPRAPPSSNINASLIPVISTLLVEQIDTGVPGKRWKANFSWVPIWFFCLSSLLFHPLHCDQNALSKHTLDYRFSWLQPLRWFSTTYKNCSWDLLDNWGRAASPTQSNIALITFVFNLTLS